MHHGSTHQVNYIKTANLNTQSIAFTNCARADSHPQHQVHTLNKFNADGEIKYPPPSEIPQLTAVEAEATASKDKYLGGSFLLKHLEFKMHHKSTTAQNMEMIQLANNWRGESKT